MMDAFVNGLFSVLGAAIAVVANWLYAKSQRKHDFKLAAIEKRLAAHQEAYTLWCELSRVLHKQDERSPVVLKCQDWWEKNCLYLDAESRERFRQAYVLAFTYEDHKAEGKARETFDEIMEAGRAVVRGIGLPPVCETDTTKGKSN